MSVLSGFKKYIHHTTDSNGDHIKQSFWTSSDTVDGKITESSSRSNLNDGETLTTSLGKIKKWFADLGTSAFKNITNSYDPNGTDPVSGQAVAEAIEAMPEPMIFKGSLGTGGTITTLPTASKSVEGFTYKVITAGTYASQVAKVGDTFICSNPSGSAYEWVLIPSGDEPEGTVTSVGITNGNNGISTSGGPITASGTLSVSHADTSNQASTSNSGRTYIQNVTLDDYGHVTKLTTGTETVVNTDTLVTQTATTTSADYEILFSATADNTTRTETARKNNNLTFNPNTGNLKTTQLNGVTVGSSPKFTDTTYESKTAASGGTALSLVTTGEKYTWNNKTAVAVKGNAESTYRTGNVNLTPANIGALPSNGTAVAATKATQDGDGNTISTTYMKKGVDYVTAGKKSGTTLGSSATAEGYGTTASGIYSHAEGYSTTASEKYSHAECFYTTASGSYSHAEGYYTTASGMSSHAEGHHTIAKGNYQHVEGKYNVEDTNFTYAHIIGGGSSTSERKNIFTVDWNGDVCAGRSNGLTNDLKLPTGADVISYLNSNLYRQIHTVDVYNTANGYGTFGVQTSRIIGAVCENWGGAIAFVSHTSDSSNPSVIYFYFISSSGTLSKATDTRICAKVYYV